MQMGGINKETATSERPINHIPTRGEGVLRSSAKTSNVLFVPLKSESLPTSKRSISILRLVRLQVNASSSLSLFQHFHPFSRG
jgi:hypothetical protein